MAAIRTPRDAAKDLIRWYVERGCSEEYLRNSHMGHAGPAYVAQIAGIVWDLAAGPDVARRFGPDKIGVEEVAGVKCCVIFNLHELYEEIKRELAGDGAEQMSMAAWL